jgi:cytidylate kinase
MKPVIAIDGPAGAGKSTVARAVAKALDWSYLDTGAMYRAVTWWAMHAGVDIEDATAVASIARTCELEVVPRVRINGQDVTDLIRSAEVNIAVSKVAAEPSVRQELVQRQRMLAEAAPLGSVVEGRDITTVVFPDAHLKIFLTASPEERVRRRGDEDAASLARRDAADEGREVSPLRQSKDAVVLDTTGLSVDEVVERVVSCHKALK